MPLKIKKLKTALAQAGFNMRTGKDGDDAQPYQIKDVRNALRKVGKAL
jgi:hypothetical protein